MAYRIGFWVVSFSYHSNKEAILRRLDSLVLDLISDLNPLVYKELRRILDKLCDPSLFKGIRKVGTSLPYILQRLVDPKVLEHQRLCSNLLSLFPQAFESKQGLQRWCDLGIAM